MFANNKMRENSGRLIKIYRERMHQGSKDKRFSCNEFILATKDHPFYEIVEGESVCSRATLNRLERGQIIKDDELYVFFIEKLGFKVDDFPGVMTNVERLSDELFKAVELYDLTKIKTIDDELDQVFKDKKEYFYYIDIYDSFKVITKYYLAADYPTKEVADRVLSTCFVLPKNMIELVLNILFDYYYFKCINVSVSEAIYNTLNQFELTSISCLYCAFWLMYKEKWITALTAIDNGINYFQTLNSNYQLGILYFSKALALHTGNKENVKYFFDKSIQCLENSSGILAEKKLVKNYFNIGFHYYFDKEYEQAMFYFRKFINRTNTFSIHDLYILRCAKKLNDLESLEKLKAITFQSIENEEINKVFYNYFIMRLGNETEKNLENYITHDIHKIMATKYRSDNLIKYFEEELNDLAKVTKCYKAAIKFNNFTSHKIDWNVEV